ncbi:hypothetical protein Hanom_Chr01g00011361 [Helianthus anomalus]
MDAPTPYWFNSTFLNLRMQKDHLWILIEFEIVVYLVHTCLFILHLQRRKRKRKREYIRKRELRKRKRKRDQEVSPPTGSWHVKTVAAQGSATTIRTSSATSSCQPSQIGNWGKFPSFFTILPVSVSLGPEF